MPDLPRAAALHVRPGDVALVHEPEQGLSMRALVPGRSSGDGLSLTEVTLDGVHRRLRAARTTRTYSVLDGEPPQRT